MEQEIHEYDEGGFNLRLEARLKNAALINAREQLGLTGKEAATQIGISYTSYLNYEAMRSYPPLENQKKICDFYRSKGILILEEEVFPEELGTLRLRKMVLEREIPRSKLLSLTTASHMHLLPSVSIETEIENEELKDSIQEVLSHLNPREAATLRMYYGLEGEEPKTYDEIAPLLGVTRSRIGQIHDKALTKMRGHDSWGRKFGKGIGKRLEVYLENLSR